MTAMVARWLLKTEPEEWSWEHQQANGGVSHWDGVRNAQAQKHLRAMAEGDLCFFYHSGSKAKEIVGIARVCKPFYPDPSDASSKHGMVDIEAVSKLDQPVPLARLKQEDRLHSFILFRQPRLSVIPVSISEWDVICELSGLLEPPSYLDNGDVVSYKASEMVCNVEATNGPLSTDDNGNLKMRVKEQDLELCDGETRVSLAHMIEEGKSLFSDDNGSNRVRVLDQDIELRDDETRARRNDVVDKPSRARASVRIRERRKPPTYEVCTDGREVGLRLKDSKTPPLTHENPRVAGVEIAEGSTDVDVKGEEDSSAMPCYDFTMEVSKTKELASDTYKVYSRRIKQRKLDSLPNSTELTDSSAVVSDPGRVYKRKGRKQRLVESLLS